MNARRKERRDEGRTDGRKEEREWKCELINVITPRL
jgi:hypothetical protein